MGTPDTLSGIGAGTPIELDSEALLKAAGESADGDDDGGSGDVQQSFRDLLGPDCVIKRVDKDRNVLSTAQPEEMQHEMMTRAAAQKRLGACADHVKDMSREAKLNWALELKDRANEFYLANNFEEAAKLYNDCLVALDFEGTAAENRVVEIKLQLPVCTNLAACMIEMGQYSRCIEICDVALSVDAEHAKARYRRGLAYYRLGNHVAARPDFEAALRSIDENHPEPTIEANGTDGEKPDKDAAEETAKSLADLKRRILVYLNHIRRFSVEERKSCQRMFEKDLYADRPDAKRVEDIPTIDDSDEALDAALERIRGDWNCCPCRRRPKEKES